MSARLALLSESDAYGGAERYLLALIERLDRERFDPVYIGPARTPERILESLDRERVPFVPSERIVGKADLRGFRDLRAALRRERPTITHINLSNPLHGQYAMLTARWSGVPVTVATMHLPPRQTTPTRRGRWFEKQTLGQLDRLIMVCDASRTLALAHMGVPPDRTVSIHNGIDPGAFSAERPARAPDDVLTIGTVARLTEQKGLIHLVNAAALILETRANVRFQVAGSGPLEASLKDRTAELGISDRFEFLGERSDIPDLLSRYDIFVLPSLYESFPFTILEAMAAGCPVVSTEVDGIPESVEHGRTGLLVPPQEEPALAEALGTLLDDGQLRQKMGRAGRDRVRSHFTLDRMCDETFDLYDRCLAEAGIR